MCELNHMGCPIDGCQSTIERDRGALIKHLTAEHGLALIETLAYLDRLLPLGVVGESTKPAPPKEPAARTSPCGGAKALRAAFKTQEIEPPAPKVRPPSKRSVMAKQREARKAASAELSSMIRERFGRLTNLEMAVELGVSLSKVKGRVRQMVERGELLPDAPMRCPHCHDEIPLNKMSRHSRLCGSNPERFVTEVERKAIESRGKAVTDPSLVIRCPVDRCDCVRSGPNVQHNMMNHLLRNHGIRAEEGRQLMGLPTKEEVWIANLHGGLKTAPLEEGP